MQIKTSLAKKLFLA